MSEPEGEPPKPATAIDEADGASDDSDYEDDGGDAEEGDYDDEDEDEGADFDADDESDVDADTDSSEQPAPDPIAEPPPPPPAASGRGTLMVVGVFVAIIGVFAYFKLRTPDEVVPPAVWARYHDTANTFSLELPAQPIQSTDPQPNLAVRLGAREYAVLWDTMQDPELWKHIGPGFMGEGTVVRQLSIPDSDEAFVFKTKQGGFTGIRTTHRGTIGYVILTGAYIDDPDLERPLRTFRLEPAPP